jgi:acyl carrier protein
VAAVAEGRNWADGGADDGARSQAERIIVDVFSAVLLVPIGELDRDSDFFEIGGDSVLAGRVIARVQPHFEVRLQMRDLFSATTPAALAELVLERCAHRHCPARA